MNAEQMAQDTAVRRTSSQLRIKKCFTWTCAIALIAVATSSKGQEETPLRAEDRAVDVTTKSSTSGTTSSTTSPAESAPPAARSAPRASNSAPRNPAQNAATPAPARPSSGAGSTGATGSTSRRIENLDFKDAPLADVVRAFSSLTGKNFILDPAAKGSISIMAPSSVSQEEAYQAFLSALAINGYTVVPSGKFLKILPSKTAARDSINTFTSQAPDTDQIVTRIVKLNHLPVNTITKYLRTLVSKDGDMIGYDPTNSLIITDYGSNIRRLDRIIRELDKPGFEERMTVIPIRYAKAKELASMIEKLTGQDQRGRGFPGAGGPGLFPQRNIPANDAGTSGNLSLVVPDERTNSLVVLGDAAGIAKVKVLVEELDFNLDPSEGGGIFVYHLKHSVAENVEKTLNNLISKAVSAPAAGAGAASATRPFTPPGTESLFGGDVKITSEKATNSLIVMASRQDYTILENLLKKIDVPRDQVYVEAIIMEINSDKTRDWRVAAYHLDPGSKGVGRAGFASPGALQSLINPVGDAGLVLGLGAGQTFGIQIANQVFQIPSLLGFVNFLKQHADANILSTPQVVAMDNEEASIEVGDQIPIGIERTVSQLGRETEAPRFDKASIKLTITPYISADSNVVRMKVDQSVRQASEATVRAESLRDIATVISDRSVKTNITVNDQQTIVLGGLIRSEDSTSEAKVPFLGDVPILGWLFKSSKMTKKKVNLLIFLTPRIIRSSEDQSALLGRKIDERRRWIDANDIIAESEIEVLDGLRATPVPVAPETAPTPLPVPATPAPAPATLSQPPPATEGAAAPNTEVLTVPEPVPTATPNP